MFVIHAGSVEKFTAMCNGSTECPLGVYDCPFAAMGKGCDDVTVEDWTAYIDAEKDKPFDKLEAKKFWDRHRAERGYPPLETI